MEYVFIFKFEVRVCLFIVCHEQKGEKKYFYISTSIHSEKTQIYYF